MNIKKILIIQTAFIGDVVLTTPLIKAVKDHYKNARVHVMVIPAARNLVENNPDIDAILVFDKKGRDKGLAGLIKTINTVRKNNYNLVISPHRSFRSALIAFLSGADKRIAFNTSAGRLLFTDIVQYQHNVHEIERNLSLLSPLALVATDKSPHIYFDQNDREKVDSLLNEHGMDNNKPLAAIAPGSVWFTKKWPEEYYIQLAARLSESGISIVLIGSKEDKELCNKISEKTANKALNTAGELTLRQSTALLSKCNLLVCNDSGAMHLGVAAGIPVFALFGPTVPEFGFYPFGNKHTVLEYKLNCRPCGKHGSNQCPIGTHECMRAITPDHVFKTVINYLNLGKPL